MTDDSMWRRPGDAPTPGQHRAEGFENVPDVEFDEAEPTVIVPPVMPAAGSAADDEVDPLVERDPTPVAGIPLVRKSGRRRRWIKRTLLVLAALLGIGVLYYAISLYQVWSAGHHDQARKVDAIVVMGAAQYDGRPSPLLQARLDHAILLYEADYAPVIVVTGGKQSGDRFTEASASKKYLRQHGVPTSAILSESKGHSTWESLRGVSELMKQRTKSPTVLIVTDPFHCLRSRLVADHFGLRAYVSATETSPWGSGTQFRKSLKEAAGVAVGRIIGFQHIS